MLSRACSTKVGGAIVILLALSTSTNNSKLFHWCNGVIVWINLAPTIHSFQRRDDLSVQLSNDHLGQVSQNVIVRLVRFGVCTSLLGPDLEDSLIEGLINLKFPVVCEDLAIFQSWPLQVKIPF